MRVGSVVGSSWTPYVALEEIMRDLRFQRPLRMNSVQVLPTAVDQVIRPASAINTSHAWRPLEGNTRQI